MAATPTDLCQVPAGPPPPGVEPNFIDPTSLAPAKMTILSILVAWGIVFTSGRFYVNFRRLSLTDYLTLFALLLAIIILGLMSTSMRTDRHIWDTPACWFDSLFAKVWFSHLVIECIHLTSESEYLFPSATIQYRRWLRKGFYLLALPADLHHSENYATCHLVWPSF